MSLDLLFAISAIFSGLIGLLSLLSPTLYMGTRIAADPALVDSFRGVGGLFIAVAILDWMARGTGPSKARTAIVLANAIGFLFATIFTGLAVLHGLPSWVWLLVGVNALLTIGYFLGALQRTPAGSGLEPVAPKPVVEAVPTALAAKAIAKAGAARPAAKTTAKTTAKKSGRKTGRRT